MVDAVNVSNTPEFSAGQLADRPASAPELSIYMAHDTGARYRYVQGAWALIDTIADREPEQMAAPTQDELDAADAARAKVAADAAAPKSGDIAQPAPTPKPVAKAKSK